MVYITYITSAVAGLATVFTSLAIVASKYREINSKLRNDKTIIGVVPGMALPVSLDKLPDFTNYRKCLRSDAKLVVFHASSLSRALRLCDFVVINNVCDAKLINIDSQYGEGKLGAITNQ